MTRVTIGAVFDPVGAVRDALDDSRVCRAAIHAGRLPLGEAGAVWVEHRPGQDAYTGSERNGVTTSDWPRYPSSFAFIDAP